MPASPTSTKSGASPTTVVHHPLPPLRRHYRWNPREQALLSYYGSTTPIPARTSPKIYFKQAKPESADTDRSSNRVKSSFPIQWTLLSYYGSTTSIPARHPKNFISSKASRNRSIPALYRAGMRNPTRHTPIPGEPEMGMVAIQGRTEKWQ